MTKVHSGLLNMDKSTLGVSQKGVSFRTTRHNVNRWVQTDDLITSGLGEGIFFSFISKERRTEFPVSLNLCVLLSV